jgi:hypothetical protein
VNKENLDRLKEGGMQPDEFLQEFINNIHSVPTPFLGQIEKSEPITKVLNICSTQRR